MRKWEVRGPSDVVGCLDYYSLDHFHGELGGDTDALDLPLAVALERLVVAGWVSGRDPDSPHADPTDRVLCLEAGFASRPTYFACLLKFDAVVLCGLSELWCNQPDKYYQAVVMCANSSIVPHGLQPSQYGFILKKCEKGNPLRWKTCLQLNGNVAHYAKTNL